MKKDKAIFFLVLILQTVVCIRNCKQLFPFTKKSHICTTLYCLSYSIVKYVS